MCFHVLLLCNSYLHIVYILEGTYSNCYVNLTERLPWALLFAFIGQII